jgi:hypothetical protein
MTIITGLIAFLASYQKTEAPWLWLLNILSSFGETEFFSKESSVLNGIVGGLMIGWGLMLLLLSEEIMKSIILWRSTLIGLTAWFIVDSFGSWLSGYHLNIVLNFGFLFPFVIALILIKPKGMTSA